MDIDLSNDRAIVSKVHCAQLCLHIERGWGLYRPLNSLFQVSVYRVSRKIQPGDTGHQPPTKSKRNPTMMMEGKGWGMGSPPAGCHVATSAAVLALGWRRPGKDNPPKILYISIYRSFHAHIAAQARIQFAGFSTSLPSCLSSRPCSSSPHSIGKE